jgi:YjbE family integral membrane protein
MSIDSPDFWSALLAIIAIDLVLAGDNAIVIALAARNLPKPMQMKAVLWGTVGAVLVRTSLTVVVLWLLKIPGLMAAGGLMLVWIAWKRLVGDAGGAGDGADAKIKPATTFAAAIRTIVVADAVMGLDNVLAVAGAANGSVGLVIAGLLISIPIVVWGSTLVLRLLERHPNLLYLGGAILAWTAGKMLVSEPLFKATFDAYSGLGTAIIVVIVVGVVGGALLRKRRLAAAKESSPPPEVTP